MLPATLPDRQGDSLGLALHQPDVDIGMPDVLLEGTSGTGNGDEARFDSDFNALWDLEFFGFENVAHLDRELLVTCRKRIRTKTLQSSLFPTFPPAQITSNFSYSIIPPHGIQYEHKFCTYGWSVVLRSAAAALSGCFGLSARAFWVLAEYSSN